MDLLDPPSGPRAVVPGLEVGSRAAYRVWLRTEDGARVWSRIELRALELALKGRARISTKALVEEARLIMVVHVNNYYTAYLADDLVKKHPVLLAPRIERRVRKKVDL